MKIIKKYKLFGGTINNYPDIENLTESEIIELYKNNKLPYPYLKYYLSGNDLLLRFNRLKQYNYNLIKINYNINKAPKIDKLLFNFRHKNINAEKFLLLFDKNDYFNYNQISDYFQQEERYKCKRYDANNTPLEIYYNLNIFIKVLKYCKENYDKITPFNIHESFYINKYFNECTFFRPTIIVSLIKMFNSKRILDISSGWGDRLIGSIAANVDYYFGTDPNNNLQKGYNDILNFFGKSNKHFIIKNQPFETVKIELYENKKFDLVMTSPPYFDLEIYDLSREQSVIKNKSINKWLDNFLLPSINKAWNSLGVNGIFAINIGNKSVKDDYVKIMIEYLNNLYDSDYRGCLSYGEYKDKEKTKIKHPQPIWIWKKLPDINLEKELRKELIKDYNPEFKIVKETIKINNNDINLNIIRDDFLEAGTKQRGIIPYFQKDSFKEYVYVSPYNGSAQLTLAYSSLYTGKRVTIIINKKRPMHPLTKKALSYGVINLIEIENGNFKKLNEYANNYIEWKEKEKGNNYIKLLNLGFNDETYINTFVEKIKQAFPESLLKNKERRFWVPSGSATLINTLYKVFPKDIYTKTTFIVVQIGKTIWDDMLDLSRTIIYRTDEHFYKQAKEQPPYPTTESYDAKIWHFIKKYGENNDYVFNITKDN